MITISDRGLLALGVCAAIGLVAVALCLGDPTVGPAHAVQALMDASNPLHTHVAVVRLPRAVAVTRAARVARRALVGSAATPQRQRGPRAV